MVHRRTYVAGPRALAATGKSILVYDVPVGAKLAAWDAILISQKVVNIGEKQWQ